MSQKSILLIGSKSRIGSVGMRFFQGAGYRCTGTDRSTLDLANVPDDWTPPPGLSGAVFCAAVTNIHECEKDPAGSRRVNVDGTIAVMKKLSAAGVRTVFLSTNLVFSGEKPGAAEDQPPKPQTVYGAQKAEVESWIRDHMRDYAILRIAKVLVGEKTLIFDWMQDLLAGREITPFSDLSFCPVTAETVLTAVKFLLENPETGVFHLSGGDELTYERAAQSLCRMMNLPLSLVHGTPARQLGYKGVLPKYSTLDMARLEKLGMPRPSSQDELTTYIRSILTRQNSGGQ